MIDATLLAAALRAAADALDGGATPGKPSTADVVTDVAPTRTAPKPKPKPEPEPEVEEDDGSEGIDYETVSALVVRVSKEKGRDVAINFLKTFKTADKKPATKGAEIQPKDYPRAVEEATKLLEEEDDVS